MSEAVFVAFQDTHERGLFPRILRGAFARLRQIEIGCLEVVLPDGRSLRFEGAAPGPQAIFRIHSRRFARRLAAGDVGFADGYIEGEWDSPNVTALLELIGANQTLVEKFRAHPFARWTQQIRHWLRRNTRHGSRRNIHAHYDLGNEFYSAWLDPSMTYSSGIAVDGDLEAAQSRKYAAIAAAASLEAHHTVLEIGCGWGGFAEWAAREIGCRVVALTISDAQFRHARERIARAGLSDKVEIRLQDYRDVDGSFDRVVSIEMFEAVGEEYWEAFFRVLGERLKPGGRAALQIITIREDLFDRYRAEMDFIRHYIFPGGMLPTNAILKSLGARAGLSLTSDMGYGRDYAETCRIWRRNFEDARPRIAQLGFDGRFRRLWAYYLSYCEAGFRVGTIDLRQISFALEDATP